MPNELAIERAAEPKLERKSVETDVEDEQNECILMELNEKRAAYKLSCGKIHARPCKEM